jgi:hypothetical protein
VFFHSMNEETAVYNFYFDDIINLIKEGEPVGVFEVLEEMKYF